VLAHHGGDEVEELPAAQRVVDDVGVVRRPQRRRRPAQVLRHLLDLEHRAVAHVARDRRLAVADDPLAHHRAHAVGANERCGADELTSPGFHQDFIPLNFIPRDPRAGAQLDQRLRLAAVEERAVDVGAVRHRVGIAEALGEALVERHVDHRLAARAVHEQQALDEHRLLLHQRADAERVDGVPGVGGELDAGADLAELLRLLQHDGAEALAREGERAGEPAEAAAGDHHGLLVPPGHGSASGECRNGCDRTH